MFATGILGIAEADRQLRPIIDERYASDNQARTAMHKVETSFREWIIACHQYRHEPGTEEPAQPPLSLAITLGLIESPGSQPMLGITFQSLTWGGADYLDAVRDPKTWERTREAASSAGGFTFDLIKDLAKGFIKKQIEERTGVKL